MTRIRTNLTVFLGITVNPKTKEPVFVERAEYEDRTINILVAAAESRGGRTVGELRKIVGLQPQTRFVYDMVGEGYLQSDEPESEYYQAIEVTGLPRSHTPQGIASEYRNKGYGTCLYTGLLLLATAHKEGDIDINDLGGHGAGICSDKSTRSASATEWWDSAVERGLAHQKEGEVRAGDDDEYDEEVLEDEDLESYMSNRSRNNIISMIAEATEQFGDGYTARNISMRGDLVRDVPREHKTITADYYRFADAVRHNLVAVLDPTVGDTVSWAQDVDAKLIDNAAGAAYAKVILSLNVANQDPRMVGKLALIARAAGANDADITEMVMRNRHGWDQLTWAPQAPVAVSRDLVRNPGRPTRTRLPPPCQCGASAGRHSHPRREAARFVRNPAEPSASEERALIRASERLAERRAELGWDILEVLP